MTHSLLLLPEKVVRANRRLAATGDHRGHHQLVRRQSLICANLLPCLFSSVLPCLRGEFLAENAPGPLRSASTSCGPSSHLLEAFSRLPPLDHLELGPGTDLAVAARALPGVPLSPLIDPVLMRQQDPAAVRTHIEQTLSQTAPSPATTLCIWSLDRDTPIENVAAVYETVAERDPPQKVASGGSGGPALPEHGEST